MILILLIKTDNLNLLQIFTLIFCKFLEPHQMRKMWETKTDQSRINNDLNFGYVHIYCNKYYYTININLKHVLLPNKSWEIFCFVF